MIGGSELYRVGPETASFYKVAMRSAAEWTSDRAIARPISEAT